MCEIICLKVDVVVERTLNFLVIGMGILCIPVIKIIITYIFFSSVVCFFLIKKLKIQWYGSNFSSEET